MSHKGYTGKQVSRAMWAGVVGTFLRHKVVGNTVVLCVCCVDTTLSE